MDINFRNGSIELKPGDPGRPESRSESNGVTLINTAIPATPGQFEVTFFIGFADDGGASPVHNHVHLTLGVAEDSEFSQYRAIEDAAAKRVPELLRNLAQEIEREIAGSDANRAARG